MHILEAETGIACKKYFSQLYDHSSAFAYSGSDLSTVICIDLIRSIACMRHTLNAPNHGTRNVRSGKRLPEAFHDYMRTDAFFDVTSDFFQQLCCK